MYARAAQLIAEQGALDTPISPRKTLSTTLDAQGGREEGNEGNSTATKSGGGGDFAPILGVVDQVFFFAMVWGLGGGLLGDPALAFDVCARDLIQVNWDDGTHRCMYMYIELFINTNSAERW